MAGYDDAPVAQGIRKRLPGRRPAPPGLRYLRDVGSLAEPQGRGRETKPQWGPDGKRLVTGGVQSVAIKLLWQRKI